MKKNVIALILSFAVAAGSICTAPVCAAENGLTAVEAEMVEAAESEEPLEDEQPEEESEVLDEPDEAPLDISEQEETEEQSVEVTDGTVDEIIDLPEDMSEQFGDNEPDSSEAEDDQQNVISEEIPESEEISKESQYGDESGFRREGMCGDNVKWVLTGTNPDSDPDLTLTISGKGDMRPVDTYNWTLYNDAIGKVVIEEGVTSIGEDAFSGFEILETVTIPVTVQRIGGNAFAECHKLNHVKIPNGVTTIEEGTFSGCSSLTDIEIPDSVTCFEDIAFYECISLTEIKFPEKAKKVGAYTFKDCHSLESIIIPEGVTDIEYQAFFRCWKLESVSIPSTVTFIDAAAFYECSSLKSVTIPDGVTRVEDYTFFKCNSLKDAVIPDGVTFIGIEAFYDCSSLSNMKIPSALESIENSAFFGCNSLKSVTIPDGVTKIKRDTFYNCSSLKDLRLSENLNSIGNSAFSGCSSLTGVKIPNKVTSIGSNAFYGCSSLTEVSIPDSVTNIGIYAFSGCVSLIEIKIPGSVGTIGEGTFSNCSSLKSVEISDGVTSIGKEAFSNCNKLEKAVILCSVTSIEQYAFYAGGSPRVPIEKLTIYGYYGSYAEFYANKNGIPFVDLNGMSWDNQGTYSPYKTIALQAASTGHYITCDIGAKDGNGKYPYMNDPDLNADATWIRSHEKFELVPCSDGSYALRSAVNRQFIKYYRIETDNGTYDYISCDADFVDEDVKLTLTKGERGKIKFKNRNVWLCIKDDKLAFTDDENEASVFNQILIDDNRYTSKTLEKLSCDEWFELGNLNNYGLGGLYDIQWDVGHKSTYNANTLRNLGYKIMNVEDQLGKRDYIEIYNMQCFVAYKETNGSYDVIIAFQGTDGYDDKVADGQSNIHGGGEAGSDGMHQGYSAMAKKLIDNEGSVYGPSKSVNLKRLIESEDAKNGKIQFTILGHSMGGAIAQCYALHLNEEGVPKDKIKGRTFNSALAVIKDYEDFTDWINLCVSSDSVCNGLVTGSILLWRSQIR